MASAIPTIPPTILFNYRNTHRAGCTFNLLHRAVEVDRVQIFHLQLGDLLYLGARYLTDLLFVRYARAFRDLGGFAQEHCCWWGLQYERERPIGINSDFRGQHFALTIRRAGIVLLTKGHDVDTMTSQRGAYRRRLVGFSSFQLETNDCLKLLCHFYSFVVLAWRLGATPTVSS